MTIRGLALALLLIAPGLFAGCDGGSGDTPFTGTWVSTSGASITFADSTWYDSEGDSGTYSYTGDYPGYTVTFVSNGISYVRQATFADTQTLELCRLYSSGEIGTCTDLVLDRPTVH